MALATAVQQRLVPAMGPGRELVRAVVVGVQQLLVQVPLQLRQPQPEGVGGGCCFEDT